MAIISEPYVGGQSFVSNIAGIQIFQHPLPDTRVKACLFVKNQLTAYGLDQYSSPNFVVAQIQIEGRNIDIASIYVEPRHDPLHTMQTLTTYLDHRDSSRILGGDFNGHHPMWGLSTTQ